MVFPINVLETNVTIHFEMVKRENATRYMLDKRYLYQVI